MVLLVLQDSRVEGPLLPLLWGQGDLTAEPPREEGPDSGCTGGRKRVPHPSSAALRLRSTEETHLLAASWSRSRRSSIFLCSWGGRVKTASGQGPPIPGLPSAVPDKGPPDKVTPWLSRRYCPAGRAGGRAPTEERQVLGGLKDGAKVGLAGRPVQRPGG